MAIRLIRSVLVGLIIGALGWAVVEHFARGGVANEAQILNGVLIVACLIAWFVIDIAENVRVIRNEAQRR